MTREQIEAKIDYLRGEIEECDLLIESDDTSRRVLRVAEAARTRAYRELSQLHATLGNA